MVGKRAMSATTSRSLAAFLGLWLAAFLPSFFRRRGQGHVRHLGERYRQPPR